MGEGKYVPAKARYFGFTHTGIPSRDGDFMAVDREEDVFTRIRIRAGEQEVWIKLEVHTLRALGKHLIRQADRIDDAEAGYSQES